MAFAEHLAASDIWWGVVVLAGGITWARVFVGGLVGLHTSNPHNRYHHLVIV